MTILLFTKILGCDCFSTKISTKNSGTELNAKLFCFFVGNLFSSGTVIILFLMIKARTRTCVSISGLAWSGMQSPSFDLY